MLNRITAIVAKIVLILSLEVSLAAQLSFLPTKVNGVTWGTIYIRADGTIDPPTAPITKSADNLTYTLTADIDSSSDGIVIEKDNITLDGSGYTVRSINASPPTNIHGINATNRQNLQIENLIVADFYNTAMSYGYGMWIYNSVNVSVHDCKVRHNSYGIHVGPSCSKIKIYKNEVVESFFYGVAVEFSYDTYVYKNEITNTQWESVWVTDCHNAVIAYNNINSSQAQTGISLYSSDTLILLNQIISGTGGIWFSTGDSNDTIARNNFVVSGLCSFDVSAGGRDDRFFNNNFTKPPYDYYNFTYAYYTALNNSYPSCGNYWVTYNGSDTDGDGIGNTPYSFGANVTDYLPFMCPFNLTMDVNRDGIVNMRDVGQVILAYGSQPGDANWNWFADVDGNGVINQTDINIVIRYFSCKFYAH
jgi:parallel beta-helix repeat protein